MLFFKFFQRWAWPVVRVGAGVQRRLVPTVIKFCGIQYSMEADKAHVTSNISDLPSNWRCLLSGSELGYSGGLSLQHGIICMHVAQSMSCSVTPVRWWPCVALLLAFDASHLL
jgi:hypothetical protein